MSLLKTKPRWFPGAIATNQGWINPITKEVLIAIGNLKQLLTEEAEASLIKSNVLVEISPKTEVENEKTAELTPAVVPIEIVVETPIVIKEELVMNEETPMSAEATRTRKQYAPRKPKVISEVVEYTNYNVINEVVEYPSDSKIIIE